MEMEEGGLIRRKSTREERGSVGEGLEEEAIGLEKFWLKFHPVQSKRVQETFHYVHSKQNRRCYAYKHRKAYIDGDRIEEHGKLRGHCRVKSFVQKNER